MTSISDKQRSGRRATGAAAIRGLLALIMGGLALTLAALACLSCSDAGPQGISVDQATYIIVAFEGRLPLELEPDEDETKEGAQFADYMKLRAGPWTTYHIGRYTGLVEQAFYGENIEFEASLLSEEEAIDTGSAFLREHYPAHARLTLVDATLTSEGYRLEWAELADGERTSHSATIHVNPETGMVISYTVVPLAIIETFSATPAIDSYPAIQAAEAKHTLRCGTHLQPYMFELKVMYFQEPVERMYLAWEVYLAECIDNTTCGYVRYAVDARTGETRLIYWGDEPH